MCDRHVCQFDVEKAYQDQLVSALEACPEHSLSAPEAPRQPSVCVLSRSSLPVYVGQARHLCARLRHRLKQIENRKGITIDEVSGRFLTIERMSEVVRAEDALIRHYNPGWGQAHSHVALEVSRPSRQS
jgi:hypothetical protein